MTHDLTAAISQVLDAHQIGGGYLNTPVPGLTIMRAYDAVMPQHMTYKPSLCVIAQGAKQVTTAERTLTYGDMQSLVVTIDIPVLSQIVRVSRDKPYVAATLNLNAEILLDVLTQLGDGLASVGRLEFGMLVKDLDSHITGSLIRLLDLIGRPQAVDVLYPAIMREVSYWLLTGPAGPDLARMVATGGQPHRIARAVRHLRDNFDATVNMAELASIAGMSTSSFHQHFKVLTSMSPLQYQKQLRLMEARRLMLADGQKASVAGFAVGYESVSQFSREYARMFGAPPHRETRRALGGGAFA